MTIRNGKSVSDRTRKKRNSSEITEEDWKIAKAKLASVKEAIAHLKVQGAAPDKDRASMEEYGKECVKAMQPVKKADLPTVLQSQLQEVQRAMENRALAKAKTPPKLEEPKTEMASNAKTSTITTTTLAKTGLHKEKEVKVQQQKEEEKKDKAGKEQPDIMEIPSTEECGPELTIEERTTGRELEAESVAANVDATEIEGETREVVKEQEVEEGEREWEEREQEAMETSVPTPYHTY